MAETDPIVQRLLPLLNSWMISPEYTKEELIAIIYVSSEERLSILKCLMSQFSEDYKNDLENSKDVEWELIRQINALQFSDSSNKITFVRASCSIKEQQKVFKNIIHALGFLNFAENAIAKRAEPLPYKESNCSKERKKQDFDLIEAEKHLEEATKLIEKYKYYLEEPTKKEIPVEINHDCEPLDATAVAEIYKNINDISYLLRSLPLDHTTPEHQLEPSKDITKLHDILVANREVILNSTKDDLEVETFNPRIFLEEVSNFRQNSKLINLKHDN